MAKCGKTSKKTSSKGKKNNKKTQKAGCKCKAPLFFTGGASPDLPYPINMHNDDLRGVSTRIMPNMTGGKSKPKGKKRGTRKRNSKK
jgi:hypothetical protein